MRMNRLRLVALSVATLVAVPVSAEVLPSASAFTYQGRLTDGGSPASGLYDFELKLYDALDGGNQVGSIVTINDQPVSNGLFTLKPDFGAGIFTGDARWLEIGVRPGAETGAYTMLSPRQELTPTPYALYALNAPAGSSLWQQLGYDIYYNSGNVGIGTATPSSRLSVGGTLGVTDSLVVGGTTTTNGFRMSVGSAAGHVLTSDASGNGTWQQAGGVWQQAGYDIYYNSGHVGVGVSAPQATLHVAGGNGDLVGTEGDFKIGNSSYRLKIGVATSGGEAGTSRIFASGPSSKLILGANGSEHITLAPAFNVGIGTTTPSSTAKLDVAGRIEMDYFRLTNFPEAGYVLTCDASGNGTWQEPAAGGITLPYDDIITSSSAAFSVTNDNISWTTGMLAQELVGVEGTTDHSEGSGVRGANDYYGSQGILGQGKYGVFASTSRSDAPAGLFMNTGGGLALRATGGVTQVDVLQIMGGSDLAEQFDVGGEVRPGMVVMIDPDNPGKLCLSRGAYNRCVAGVISGANGVDTGMVLSKLSGEDNTQPVALSGRVWVYCDADDKAIEPGNMLTTAGKPGHAMAVTDFDRAHGAVLGKAMSKLAKGETGMVLALVNLQ